MNSDGGSVDRREDEISFSYSSDDDFIPDMIRRKHSGVNKKPPPGVCPWPSSRDTSPPARNLHHSILKGDDKRESSLSLDQKRRRLSSVLSATKPVLAGLQRTPLTPGDQEGSNIMVKQSTATVAFTTERCESLFKNEEGEESAYIQEVSKSSHMDQPTSQCVNDFARVNQLEAETSGSEEWEADLRKRKPTRKRTKKVIRGERDSWRKKEEVNLRSISGSESSGENVKEDNGRLKFGQLGCAEGDSVAREEDIEVERPTVNRGGSDKSIRSLPRQIYSHRRKATSFLEDSDDSDTSPRQKNEDSQQVTVKKPTPTKLSCPHKPSIHVVKTKEASGPALGYIEKPSLETAETPVSKLRLVDIDFTGGKFHSQALLKSAPRYVSKKIKVADHRSSRVKPPVDARLGKMRLEDKLGRDQPRVVSSSASNVLRFPHENKPSTFPHESKQLPFHHYHTPSPGSSSDICAQKDAILAAKFPQKRKLLSEPLTYSKKFKSRTGNTKHKPPIL